MKSPVLVACSLVVLAATLSTPAGASDRTTPAGDLMTLPSRPFIERGMTPDTVTTMLGLPSLRLSPDHWVYFDFGPTNPRFRNVRPNLGQPHEHDALVIGFENDRLIFLRLCDPRSVHGLIAAQEKSRVRAQVPGNR